MFQNILYKIQEPDYRSRLLIRLIATCWLVQKIYTWRLWTSHRTFPTAPVFDFLYQIPGYVQDGLFLSGIMLLIIQLLRPSLRSSAMILIAVELLNAMFDQNRWQPWEYQFVCVMTLLVISRKYNWFPVYVFIMGCIYTYSGLQKFDPRFVSLVWDRMMLQQFFHAPKAFSHQPFIYNAGYMLALTEFILGFLFFFRVWRKRAAIGLLLMHLYILMVLGPWGIQYNPSVWPWNLLMMCCLILVTLQKQQESVLPEIRRIRNSWILLLWGILPVFNFAGYWDHYLSMSLYSGKSPKGYICTGKPDSQKPFRLYLINKPDSVYCASSEAVISLQNWAMDELKVPVYPEKRVLNAVSRQLEIHYPDTYFHLNILEQP